MLAGGASRRMGRDKAALVVAGKSLAERAAERLREICSEVCLADGGRGLLPGCPSLRDGPGEGPAAGILGAAAAYRGRSLLVLACDLPRVPVALLAALAQSAQPASLAPGAPPSQPSDHGCDWAVPRWSRGIEPLCALYGPRALSALAAQVARGVAAPHRLAAAGELSVCYFDDGKIGGFGNPEELFLNLNTPSDFALWARQCQTESAAASASTAPGTPGPGG